MAQIPFHRFINPMVLAALEGEDERKRIQEAQPTVTMAPEFQNSPRAAVPSQRATLETVQGLPSTDNVGLPPMPSGKPVIPQYAGRVPTRMTSPQQSNTEPTATEIMNSIADPSALNNARGASTAADIALQNELQNYDPTPENLRPMRGQLQTMMQNEIGAPVNAEYNPSEEGVKGALKHLGEAALISIMNSRNPRTGEIDPLQAGIAASLSAMFGGKGIHQQIATQYKQPQLDAERQRQRQQIAFATDSFNTLARNNPNTGENRIKALTVGSESARRSEQNTEQDYARTLNVGLGERAAGRAEAAQDRAEDKAYRLALINKATNSQGDQSSRNRARMSFIDSAVSDVSSINKELAALKAKYNEARQRITSFGSALGSGELRREEEGKYRQELANAQAEAQSLQDTIWERLQTGADQINGRYKGLVTVDGNTQQLITAPAYQDVLSPYFDTLYPAPVQPADAFNKAMSIISDEDLLDRQRRFRNKK